MNKIVGLDVYDFNYLYYLANLFRKHFVAVNTIYTFNVEYKLAVGNVVCVSIIPRSWLNTFMLQWVAQQFRKPHYLTYRNKIVYMKLEEKYLNPSSICNQIIFLMSVGLPTIYNKNIKMKMAELEIHEHTFDGTNA